MALVGQTRRGATVVTKEEGTEKHRLCHCLSWKGMRSLSRSANGTEVKNIKEKLDMAKSIGVVLSNERKMEK